MTHKDRLFSVPIDVSNSRYGPQPNYVNGRYITPSNRVSKHVAANGKAVFNEDWLNGSVEIGSVDARGELLKRAEREEITDPVEKDVLLFQKRARDTYLKNKGNNRKGW